jgi:tight adherence protein C
MELVVVQQLGSLGHFVEANMVPLIAASMFGFVFLTVLGLTQIVQRRQAVRRRAVAFNPASGGLGVAGFGIGSLRTGDSDAASELLYSVERGLPRGDRQVSKLRQELIQAGFFRNDAVFYYYVIRLALAFALAALAVTLLRRFVPTAAVGTVLGATVIASAVGLLIPTLVLGRYQQSLRQQCRNGFPNFLDLLVVCSEAGLTPRAGIERVSRELTHTHPFLGANLFLMCLELRAGRPLVEAIEGLGRRINIEEIRSLGSLLQQTEELGANLSTSLRVYSEEMRARRLLRAEEKAHALPVKLVLPLAFFVFPVMMVVTLLPVMIRIYKAFL